jgi:hypothetical protein
MKKFMVAAIAVAAGAIASGASAPVAEAATFVKPPLAAQQTSPIVNVHYRRFRHVHVKRGNKFRRCAQLRRQAARSGSRWAWNRYRAVCR